MNREKLKSVLKKFKVQDEIDIKTIIIDKDFSELKAIKETFPGTNIIICKFHIKQAFDRQIKKIRRNHQKQGPHNT